MKKVIFFAAALGLLTACDPIKDDGTMSVDQFTADQLLQGAVFEQYSDAECATPAANGNYIKFAVPASSSVTIFVKKPDGTEQVLSSGKPAGVILFVPKRGSDPQQTLYIRYINQDGEEVVAEKQVTVAVAADLKPEMKLLVSDEGVKTWKWDASAPGGQVWGNLGCSNDGFDGLDFGINGSNKWWGVVSEEEFKGQLQHTDDGAYHNDGSFDATMVMDEDGNITCYDASGNKIRSGSFSVQDYDPTYTNSKHYVGLLNTDAGSILWPYAINEHGAMPTQFEIAYLTPAKMALVVPHADGNGVRRWGTDADGKYDPAGWAEATYWRFSSDSDVMGCLTDNNEATWTWDDDNSLCWGNAGYTGFAYGGAASISGGTWWGVPSTGLAEQISNYGYGLNDGEGATMTFDKEGNITKSSGGSGGFAYDTNNKLDLGLWDEGKTKGRFTTTGDGILFPVRINAGEVTNEFDIVYFDDDHFVLCYPNYPKGTTDASGNEAANWMEGTIWRFKKVK